MGETFVVDAAMLAQRIKNFLNCFCCDDDDLIASAMSAVDRLLAIQDGETESDLRRILSFTCEHYDAYVKWPATKGKKQYKIECRKIVRLIQQEIEEILELYVPKKEDEGGCVTFFPGCGGGHRVIRGTNSL